MINKNMTSDCTMRTETIITNNEAFVLADKEAAVNNTIMENYFEVDDWEPEFYDDDCCCQDHRIVVVAFWPGHVATDSFTTSDAVCEMNNELDEFIIEEFLAGSKWFYDFEEACEEVTGTMLFIDTDDLEMIRVVLCCGGFHWGSNIFVKTEDRIVEYIDGKRYDVGEAILVKCAKDGAETLYKMPEGHYFLHFRWPECGNKMCSRAFCDRKECIQHLADDEAEYWMDMTDGKADYDYCFYDDLLTEEATGIFRSMLAVLFDEDGIRAEKIVCPEELSDLNDEDIAHVSERLVKESDWKPEDNNAMVLLMDPWYNEFRIIHSDYLRNYCGIGTIY